MLEKLVQYFTSISSLHRALILAGGITIFWLIETAIPLFNYDYNKWRHASLNIFFTITTVIINFAFALSIVYTSKWCISHHFGLLQFFDMPLWLTMLLGLMLLDLIGAYLIHYIQHKVKWMWKFHMIHHADSYVDTTTANRHHPGESVFRAVFTLIAVFVAGAPIWLVFLYQSLSVMLAQFNHANIRMPDWLDKPLRLIIVTPNMHRIHHHYMRPETDSNFSNIFSVWDYVFRTYRYIPASNLKYGLDILEGRNCNNLREQLKLPFDRNVKTD